MHHLYRDCSKWASEDVGGTQLLLAANTHLWDVLINALNQVVCIVKEGEGDIDFVCEYNRAEPEKWMTSHAFPSAPLFSIYETTVYYPEEASRHLFRHCFLAFPCSCRSCSNTHAVDTQDLPSSPLAQWNRMRSKIWMSVRFSAVFSHLFFFFSICPSQEVEQSGSTYISAVPWRPFTPHVLSSVRCFPQCRALSAVARIKDKRVELHSWN